MLPENEGKILKSGKKSKIILFFTLFVVVISITIFAYLKDQGIGIRDFSIGDFFSGSIFSNGAEREVQVVSTIEYNSEAQPVFNAYEGQIIKVSRDGIEALNIRGEKQWTHVVSLNSPILKADGNDMLAFDKGGRNIYSLGKNSIKWFKTIDNTILNADINNDGYVAIVKKKDGYKAAVEVYDPKGTLIFTTVRGERFVLSAKVLPSDTEVVLNTVDANGIRAGTKFEFLNIRGEALADISMSNAIFPSAWSIRGNAIVAVSDIEMHCFNIGGEEEWKQSFGKVYSTTVTSGNLIVAAIRGENSGNLMVGDTTDIQILNSYGETVGIYEAKGEVTKVSSYGSIIAANTGKVIYFISSKGKLLRKYTSRNGIKDVFFINREEVAAILADSIIIAKI